MRPKPTSIAPTLLRLALGSALVVSLAACADNGDDEAPTDNETTASDPTPEDVTDGYNDDATESPTDDATSEDSGGDDDSPGLEDVPTADVGACLNAVELLSGGGVGEFPTVDCSEDHDAQVFAVVEAPDGDYPGDDAITTLAVDECGEAFEGFIGVPPAESTLEFDGIPPSEATWAIGDREIICLAFYPDLQTTNESFEGSAL